MEHNLDRFNVFVMDSAGLEDALLFAKQLGIEQRNMFIYEQLKIEDVRKIKDNSSIAVNEKEAFIFGKIGFDAQNALLKLLEEHDGFRYFIFYKTDDLLETILSRAQNIKVKQNRAKNEELLEAVKTGEAKNLILKAFEMQNLSRDEITDILQNISKELSSTNFFDKSNTINRELFRFKQFNFNQKIFLFSLFLKLSGGV